MYIAGYVESAWWSIVSDNICDSCTQLLTAQQLSHCADTLCEPLALCVCVTHEFISSLNIPSITALPRVLQHHLLLYYLQDDDMRHSSRSS